MGALISSFVSIEKSTIEITKQNTRCNAPDSVCMVCNYYYEEEREKPHSKSRLTSKSYQNAASHRDDKIPSQKHNSLQWKRTVSPTRMHTHRMYGPVELGPFE